MRISGIGAGPQRIENLTLVWPLRNGITLLTRGLFHTHIHVGIGRLGESLRRDLTSGARFNCELSSTRIMASDVAEEHVPRATISRFCGEVVGLNIGDGGGVGGEAPGAIAKPACGYMQPRYIIR